MTKKVVIYLDFEGDDICDADVYNYLNELMEDKILDWQVTEQ